MKDGKQTFTLLENRHAMEAAVPCKMGSRKHARKPQETVASESIDSNKKTKYACVVEPHAFGIHSCKKSWGWHRWKRVQFNESLQPLKRWKILDAKAAADNGGSSRRCQHDNWIGQRARRKILLMHRVWKIVHFATLMDISHLEKVEVEPQFVLRFSKVE